ncbi:MAG TPA: hypothetical protein VLK22_01980 [Candidatus Udaeobacter sp.]|nr:hypothetical protein [Candidatus Udaeobacter sp.]
MRAHRHTAKEDPRTKTERDNQVQEVLCAIAAGIDGSNTDRSKAIRMINMLCAERHRCVARSSVWEWQKMARILALNDVGVFLEGLGVSLSHVLDVLAFKRVLAEPVIAEIKQAAVAWSALGRIGN